jgi:hypothetical protein
MSLLVSTALTSLKVNLKAFMQVGSVAFTDDELKTAIADAVREYSNLRPVRTVENLSIQADVQKYDFPTGAINVQEALFTDEEVFTPLAFGIKLSPEAYFGLITQAMAESIESPALAVRSEIFTARFSQSWLGEIRVDRVERKIYIFPTPSEAQTAKIIVDKAHAISGDNTSYPTVRDEHVNIVLAYAEAILLDSLSKAYAVQDGKTGDRTINGVKSAQFLRDNASDLKKSFYANLYIPAAGRS